jgi:hypothetical protein
MVKAPDEVVGEQETSQKAINRLCSLFRTDTFTLSHTKTMCNRTDYFHAAPMDRCHYPSIPPAISAPVLLWARRVLGNRTMSPAICPCYIYQAPNHVHVRSIAGVEGRERCLAARDYGCVRRTPRRSKPGRCIVQSNICTNANYSSRHNLFSACC